MSTNLGPSLEKGIWAAVIIAAVIVILRVVAKIKIKRFGIDDGIMIFAEVHNPSLAFILVLHTDIALSALPSHPQSS